MAKRAEVKVRISGDSKSVEAAAKRTTVRLKELEKQGEKLKAEFDEGKVSAEKYARSMDTLDKEAEKLKGTMAESGKATEGLKSKFTSFASSVKANALKITAALVAVAGAFRAMETAANIEAQTNALRIQLAQQGADLDSFLAKLKEVSRGTISQQRLIAVSAKALLLGIPANKIAELLEVARASAIAMGMSTAQAFKDIAVGIGRASPMILDNLGLVIKLGEVYGTAATNVGVTAEQLTQTQKSAALLDAVLEVGRRRVALYGEAHSLAAEGAQKGRAALVDFKNAVGGAFSRLLGVAAWSVITLGEGFGYLSKGITVATKALVTLLEYIPFMRRGMMEARIELGHAIDDLDKFTEKAGEIRRKLQDFVLGMEGAKRAGAPLADSLEVNTARLHELGEELDLNAKSLGDMAALADRLTLSNRALTQSYRDASAAVNQFRGDMARQAAERRSRGQDDWVQIGGGTFTAPNAGRVVQDPDGRLRPV